MPCIGASWQTTRATYTMVCCMRRTPILLFSRAALAGVAIAGVHAVELPGVPGPAPLGPQRLAVSWGNDGFGPGGGAVSDDYRTNALSVVWDTGSWFLAVDHSMLTSKNPTGSPVAWGLPNPYEASERGQARRDELTVAAGIRPQIVRGPLTLWAQGGAGLICAGHLGGEKMQDESHVIIASDPNLLPYEDDRRRLEGLAHAGAGSAAELAGPLQVQAGILATLQSDGFARWRAESTLAMAGSGGGGWFGCRWTDWSGTAPSLVAEAVAEHERGPEVVAGLGSAAGSVRWSVESCRNLRNNAQYGVIGIAWTPRAADEGSGVSRWDGRFGMVGPDSRCRGRGFEFAVFRVWDATCSPSLRLGFRDTALEQPYTLDLASRRQLLWLGPGLQPELCAIGRTRFFADVEGGVGVRRSQAVSIGYKVFGEDGDDHRVEHTVVIARAAAGLGMQWTPESGPATGLELLLEQTSAPARQETVVVRSPTTGDIIDSKVMRMDGSAWGAIAAIVVSWRW
jgi:hypothetical protein